MTVPPLPTFLVCGIQKGGTTALHAYLDSHPDVFCSRPKELNFFDLHWDKGVEWYRSHFQGAESYLAAGEASPHTMRDLRCAERIQRLLPEARLLFVLRDPVQRAWSNYTYNLARGIQDPGQSLDQALDTEDGRARYLDKGFYLDQLRAFAEACGGERMRVLFAEQLRGDPQACLEPVFRFLGVDPERWSPCELESNATSVSGSASMRSFLFRWGQARQRLQPLVPAGLARMTRGVRSSLRQGLVGETERMLLPQATRDRLHAAYAESTRELAAWLPSGVVHAPPLPPWLRSDAALHSASR